jgi:stage IV sporulation protein FB
MAPWLTLRKGRLDVRMHVLVPAAAAAAGLLLGWGVALRYLLLLGTLLLHEMGHAGACLLLGGRAATVRVWPVFGRADVETMQGGRGAAVAAAGAAVNLAAAAAAWGLGGAFDLALRRAVPLDVLLTANLVMGVGNLVPVVPLDGGRVLRALAPRQRGG